MTVEDIINFKIRYNLETKSNKDFYIHNRMYCYALLFYKHSWSLSDVAELFSKNHATVRSALKRADYVQHHDQFIQDTELLQQQTPTFIIPAYKSKPRKKTGKKPPKKKVKSFNISLTVNKTEYIEHIKNKDLEEIYDLIWQLTVDKMNHRIRSINTE